MRKFWHSKKDVTRLDQNSIHKKFTEFLIFYAKFTNITGIEI